MNERPAVRFVALVPARAGSKGLPGKNFRTFAGKSLAARAVEAARDCTFISEIAISSDDPRAIPLAQQYAVTHLPRGERAASDTATATDVLHDVLSKWPAADEDCYVVYLQPTSPLRTAAHVQEAIELMLAGSHRSTVSVTTSPVNAGKLVTLDDRGLLRSIFGDESATSNREELPPTLVPNGAIYVFQVADFLEAGSIPISGSLPYLMVPEESVDVDSEQDWERLRSQESAGE